VNCRVRGVEAPLRILQPTRYVKLPNDRSIERATRWAIRLTLKGGWGGKDSPTHSTSTQNLLYGSSAYLSLTATWVDGYTHHSFVLLMEMGQCLHLGGEVLLLPLLREMIEMHGQRYEVVGCLQVAMSCSLQGTGGIYRRSRELSGIKESFGTSHLSGRPRRLRGLAMIWTEKLKKEGSRRGRCRPG
jgi:hypothetical protein